MKASSMKALTGVMSWSVNTREMTDTRVAIAADTHSKPITTDEIKFFLWMMLISSLKTNQAFCVFIHVDGFQTVIQVTPLVFGHCLAPARSLLGLVIAFEVEATSILLVV